MLKPNIIGNNVAAGKVNVQSVNKDKGYSDRVGRRKKSSKVKNKTKNGINMPNDKQDDQEEIRRKSQSNPSAHDSLFNSLIEDSSISPESVKDDLDIGDVSDEAAVNIPNLFDTGLNGMPFRSVDNSRSKGRISISSGLTDNEIMTAAGISSNRPEIIAKIPLYPFNNGAMIQSLLELRRFEKYLKIENMDSIWETIANINPNDIYTQLITRNTEINDDIIATHQALTQIRILMDSAINALDIKDNSANIMSVSKEYVKEILTPDEGTPDDLVNSLDDFFNTQLGFTPDCYQYFSNTKIFHSIIRELANSQRRHHPTLLQGSLGTRSDYGSVSYAAYLPEGNQSHNLNVRSVGTRYDLNPEPKLPVSDSLYTTLPTIKLLSQQDKIRALSVILHNELLISAGIGRSLGTPFVSKFGGTGIDPIEKIFGGYFDTASSVLNSQGSPGSFADFTVINENIADISDISHGILPVETKPVIIDNTEYIAGADYFVEFPVKYGKSDVRSINSYVEQLNSLMSDSLTYLTDVLALDQMITISPTSIVNKCLSIVHKVASSLSQNANSPAVPLITSTTAAMFTKAHISDRFIQIGDLPTRKSLVDLLYMTCMNYRSHMIVDGLDYVPTKSIARRNNQSINGIEDDADLSLYSSIELELMKTAWGSIDGSKYPENEMSNPQYPGSLMFSGENVGISVFEMILSVVRDIQNETQRLCQRNGSSASYLDGDGLTNYNRFDDNTIIAVVFEITRILLSELLPIDIRRGSQASNTLEENLVIIGWDLSKMRALRDFLSNIDISITENQPLENLFSEDGGALVVQNVTKMTFFKNSGFCPSDIISLITSVKEQRRFLKFSLSILRAIISNISVCNIRMNEIFELFYNTDFKESPLYKIKNSINGQEMLKSLTHEQLNTKLYAYYSMIPDKTHNSYIPRSLLTSKIENEIYKFFINTVMSGISGRALSLCLGIPAGFLKTPILINDSKKQKNSNANIVKSQQKVKNVSINVNRVSEMYPGTTFKNVTFKFDNELYILPGDLNLKVNEGQIIPPESIDDIVNETVFTRIQSGQITNRSRGVDIVAIDAEYTTILRNHIVDHIFRCIFNELSFINTDVTQFHNNLNDVIIDEFSVTVLKILTNNTLISKQLNLTTDMINDAFEKRTVMNIPNSYVLKNANKLTAMFQTQRLTPRNISDIILLCSSNLLSATTNKQRLMDMFLFDRVFCVLVTPDPVNNASSIIKTCSLDQCDEDMSGEVFLRNSLEFDINGYMCDLVLE